MNVVTKYNVGDKVYGVRKVDGHLAVTGAMRIKGISVETWNGYPKIGYVTQHTDDGSMERWNEGDLYRDWNNAKEFIRARRKKELIG